MRTLIIAAVLALSFATTAFAQTSVQDSATRLDSGTLVAYSRTASATITIAPPSGHYVYIIGVDISNCVGTAATSAAVAFITTTGITGLPKWIIGSGVTTGAVGICNNVGSALKGTTPLKSASPGTTVTLVLPAFSNTQVVSLNVYYYFAP